jgi:hypothetical protein
MDDFLRVYLIKGYLTNLFKGDFTNLVKGDHTNLLNGELDSGKSH